MAKIDGYAFACGNRNRPMTQDRDAPVLEHGRRLGRAIEVDFDDLQSADGSLVIAGKANKPRFDWREGEYVLSAFAVTSAAEARPTRAVERRFEPKYRRRFSTPIDLNPAQSRRRAQVDLEPGPR